MKLLPERQRTASAGGGIAFACIWAAALTSTLIITIGSNIPGVIATETAFQQEEHNHYRQQQRRDVNFHNPPAEPPFIKIRNPWPAYQPSLAEIDAARKNTPRTKPPISNVKGHAFDRIVQIWLENQDFEKCEHDPNLQYLASRGILLTNYHAVTHPSQPNYAASVSGDTFGMDHDNFVSFPSNISTVVDLLETRHITWAEYQEHLPYAGFQGMNYSLQLELSTLSHSNGHSAPRHGRGLDVVSDLEERSAKRKSEGDQEKEKGKEKGSSATKVPPDYVRKHNPLIMFDSVAKNETRARNIKGLEAFYRDLGDRSLPQWSFVTPNMTNDAHDTNITFAAKWLRGFLEPLLDNEYFMDRTLVVITFDENERYPIPNRVYTLLLGGAIPSTLYRTHDPMYYSHYSLLSTVSLNWDLPSLGRWDCDANILPPLSHLLSYNNTNIPQYLISSAQSTALSAEERAKYPHWNKSYPGPASLKRYTPGWWPYPNTVARCVSGRGVLQKVKDIWGEGQRGSYNYTSVYPHHRSFDGLGNAVHETVVNLTGLDAIGLGGETVQVGVAKRERAVEESVEQNAAGKLNETATVTVAELDAESGSEAEAETETETLVYGEGPLRPVDGVMDRGFSTRGHSHHHHHHRQRHHHQFSHQGDHAVGNGTGDWNSDLEEDDYADDDGEGELSLHNKGVNHNGAAGGYLDLSQRIKLVLVFELLVAGVAWLL